MRATAPGLPPYDAVGNRKTETKRKTASGPAADIVRTYQAPTPGKHDLPKVTQTGVDPHEELFTYDAAGNTKTRKTGADTETQYLEWDAEGHLKTLNQGTSGNSFVYDTTGQRLLRKDSKGTTLYLPGGNELRLDKAGTVSGTRYYGGVAMREGGKLTYLFADHHGTGTLQVIGDAAQTVTRRKTNIFGEARGPQPASWAGDKGFVGGTKDTDTGLKHLGAREYDPLTGRFISVDPIMDLSSSQQMHGYVRPVGPDRDGLPERPLRRPLRPARRQEAGHGQNPQEGNNGRLQQPQRLPAADAAGGRLRPHDPAAQGEEAGLHPAVHPALPQADRQIRPRIL
ncbi:RHS repeat domain-containing protein [Streptomyces toxytricini]|uniref:RHS repeat domain-containing protein n=1 Tax=Streptomyces toxytricini TaxID=67369 RepID=A0ABW8EEW2_STRT5